MTVSSLYLYFYAAIRDAVRETRGVAATGVDGRDSCKYDAKSQLYRQSLIILIMKS